MPAGNGYYDDCLFIDTVNQGVRKACKVKPSDIRLNLHSREWIASNEPHHSI